MRGELDRVAHKIHQDLLEPNGVRPEGGHALGNNDSGIRRPLCAPAIEVAANIANKCRHIDILLYDPHLPCLNAGNI